MKATGCRFDSATHARRRVTVGGASRSGAGRAVAARVLFEEGDDPRVCWVGQKWAVSWADFR
jgi:hypothetical protein